MKQEITLSKGEMSYIEDNDANLNLNNEPLLNVATFNNEGGGGGGPPPVQTTSTTETPRLKSLYIVIL